LPFNTENSGGVNAPFLYEEPIRSMLLKLKNDNGFAARAVAPYLAAVFMREIRPKNCIIIPVPLCKSRLRERGYNQAELLARELSQYIEKPVLTNVLIRIKQTTPQKKMNPAERIKNMKNAFAVRDAELIRNKNIVLIDDVFTTGATANECIKTLKKAGAKLISILTVACVGK
jgi:ComF family protein